MTSALSSVTHAPSASDASAVQASKPAAQSLQPVASPAKGEASPAKDDSVQLSKAAQAAVAALKELSETPVQTAKEANRGDLQAKRLLAKETASRPR